MHRTTGNAKLTKATTITMEKLTKHGTWLCLSSFVVLVVLFVLFVVPVRGQAQPAKLDEAIARLKSPDATERLDALRMLREAAYADAIGPVAPLVSDLDDRVQLAAIAAEVRFYLAEGDARTSIVDAFAGVPFSIYPRAVPPELVAALLRAMSDETRQVRLDAAYALGAIGRPLVADAEVAALLNVLGHPDAATRAAAARVCGRLLRERTAAEPLIAAMNDKDTDARAAAMWALGELRSPHAVRALTDFATYYGTSPL
ncbi:MAG: HEAT repeat domain-containing protein, partial [Acidobacteriota bacterium]